MKALLVFFVALTAGLGLLAVGVLKNTWASSPDGPRWAYLVFGVLLLAVALVPLLGIRRILATRTRRRP